MASRLRLSRPVPMTDSRRPPVEVTADEFSELFRSVSSWGQWGERGALNRLAPKQVAASARLVREGTSVTLSLPLNTVAAADNPVPAVHYMTAEMHEIGRASCRDSRSVSRRAAC